MSVMASKNALAVYKNKPVAVLDADGDKVNIALPGGQVIRVREKDFEVLHPGPVSDLGKLESRTAAMVNDAAIRETWALLESDGTALSMLELAELAYGEFNPDTAWAVFCLLGDGLYFSGTANAIVPRNREEVEAAEKKRGEKQRESGEREQFLERLRRAIKAPQENLIDINTDIRFMQDVEALAFGKSAKSKTIKDLGLSETPEDAHALLLKTGFWTNNINPHPARFGLSITSAQIIPPSVPDEERRDLTHLNAFAIDSPWSHDPDDALSIEENNGVVLYVHIADPASAILADSSVEREARDRGATLYLPEGSARMLAEESLPLFALGLSEKSPALTFQIRIGEDGTIVNTAIFPSTVKVRRITYEEADRLIDSGTDEAAAVLRGLNALAEKNLRRRTDAGAVNIRNPEVHIDVSDGKISIEPIVQYRSNELVRECMLLAGEGAGMWAMSQRSDAGAPGLAFPFVSQEQGDIPNEISPGLAGSYQLRRCMRPRTLSSRPAGHWGLGLDMYTQVTSPLRRYTDLLAHLQIRAVLRGEQPLNASELSARLGAGEAAAQAVSQAERASRNHWTAVYLADKKDSVWEAIALEKKGNRWVFMIPALALETQVPLRHDVAPNDVVTLSLKSVNIPRGEVSFVCNEG